ncbi:MAG: ketopantoate reductase family protein [Caldanaerobacter sp.]
MKKLKIAVIGSGAMGSLFGGYLWNGGHEVWLVDLWKEHIETINKKGLKIIEPDGKELVVKPYAVTETKEIGKCDLIIVFVKSYHTESVLESIKHLLKDDTMVLTLQNGLGNVEKLQKGIPTEKIIAGITGQGANVIGPGNIHHAGGGDTYIGELNGMISNRIKEISEIFTTSGLPTKVTENVEGLIWAKLLVNIAINPLTAILGVRNGVLLEIPEVAQLMKLAVEEGLKIAEHLKINIPLENPWEYVVEVAQKTYNNRSSMLQDIQNNRKTEIETLNGAIVKKGKELGIDTPVNFVLTQLIKGLEQKINF